MARLIVRLHGQETAQVELLDGQEYIAGRANDCAILLTEQKGISRQHIKICQRDGVWIAESLSRFVPLQQDGEPQQSIELEKETSFFAHPYEFHFVPTPEVKPGEEPVVAPTASPEDTADHPNLEEVRGNLEATQAGVSYLIPYLRIQYPTGESEILKLEGDFWIAGRESTCEICLRSARISRKHFELSRSREGFFVTDLGSSNGTRLNGEQLDAHEPTRLDSGDQLEVMQIQMLFEIRDFNLSNKLLQIPVSQAGFGWNSPTIGGEIAQLSGQVAMPEILPPKNWREATARKFKAFDWKKNKIRVVIGALLPLLLIGFFKGGNTDKSRGIASKEAPAFDRLTPEQKIAVKDTFNLARNLYIQGKYELCLAEIAKLGEMLPHYENSKEIGDYCEQGRDLVKRQNDNDRRKHEQEKLEENIKVVIEGCQEKLKKTASVEETSACLAPAVELNPSHPAIAEMIQNAQAREDEQKILAGEKASRNARTAKGKAEYQKAKSSFKKGLLARSIRQYEKFINTPYPNLDQVKDTAKREMASIKKQLQTKVSFYADQCHALGGKNRYKEAYLACDRALNEDPTNEPVRTLRDEMLSNLRREVKAIYEDSVLEESMGNVDSAKEKWKKIKAEDLEFDEYYKRSNVLLKKYGVGI